MNLDEREHFLWEEYKTERFCMMQYLSGVDQLAGENQPLFRTIDLGLANLRDALYSLEKMVWRLAALKEYRQRFKNIPG